MAAELDAEQEIVSDLLDRGDAEVAPLANAFLASSFIKGQGLPPGGDLSADLSRNVPAVSAAADAFERLRKALLVVSLLDLSGGELAAWMDRTPGGLDFPGLLELPYGAPGNSPSSVPEADAAWKNLLRVLSVRATDRSDLSAMLCGDALDPEVLDDAGVAAAVLDAATALNPADVEPIEALLTTGYLSWCVGLAEAARWDLSSTLQGCYLFGLTRDNGTGLVWLHEVMDISRRLGVRISDLSSLVAPADEATAARAVVAAVRGRHGEDASWVETARGLRDQIRQRQRDALLTFIYEHGDPSTSTESAVYAHYLLDPKMDPWLMTTRMKAAAGSLQILIQRALLGLEQFQVDEQSERQWSWMKNYRVWEAARKVFLYPENWIEPDLRTEKTPFFEAFERELAESEPTDEHLQNAVTHYLESLYEVADLHMLSCYDEVWSDEEGATRERFHILARTHAKPYSYWYRTRESDRSFTPWEKVDAGLEGDRIQVFAAGGEVYLFNLVWDQTETVGDIVEFSGRLDGFRRESQAWSRRALDSAVEAFVFTSHRTFSSDHYLGVAVEDGRIGVNLTYSTTEWFATQCVWSVEPSTWEVEKSFDPSRIYGESGTPGHGHNYSSVGQGLQWNNAASFDVEVGPEELPSGASGQVLLSGLPSGRLVYQRDGVFFDWKQAFFLRAPTVFTVGASTESRTLGRSFLVTSQLRDPSEYLQPLLLGFGVLYQHANAGVEFEPESNLEEVFQSSETERLPIGQGKEGLRPFMFESFQHPWLPLFLEQVRRDGGKALLTPQGGAVAGLDRQTIELVEFEASYGPTELVAYPRPVADVDFSSGGAYSDYNWELFFHGPLLVAKRLVERMRHGEALKWLRTIFDPYDQSSADPARFWKVRPLYEEDPTASVTNWGAFSGATAGAGLEAFEAQVEAWEADPFNPHLLAQMRPGTYKRAVVMQFLDTLIEWGDHLFRQDTMESIQEATQLYILASDLLGDRPPALPEQTPEERDYNELVAEHLDAFGNTMVNIENMLGQINGTGTGTSEGAPEVLGAMVPYFCIPVNGKLLGYWDTLDDRLFKLRSGLNIEGVRRSLPLYQPPIDPALLVRARAMGLSLASVVGDLSKPLPKYRFQVLLQRAQGLAGTVRALGGALLSAYEKRDAERLSALRSTHEIAIGNAMAEVRGRQVAEARAQLDSVKRQRARSLRAGESDLRLLRRWIDRDLVRPWTTRSSPLRREPSASA